MNAADSSGTNDPDYSLFFHLITPDLLTRLTVCQMPAFILI
jgi:hypothetical protein